MLPPGASSTAREAEVGLRRAQVVPVGRRLHPDAGDGHELALDAEQLPHDALGALGPR
jgi:hypothetical protein